MQNMSTARQRAAAPLTLIKVGGGISTLPGALDRLGQSLLAAARIAPLVVVPGGGPFADAVRAFEGAVGHSADAAHWMAILGMDQLAHAIASHAPGSEVIHDAAEIRPALDRGALPILAPYRWLRAADELPHTWDVTSDSLAAYLAGLLGAERLILIKPVEGEARELVDPYFAKATPASLEVVSISLANLGRLEELLKVP